MNLQQYSVIYHLIPNVMSICQHSGFMVLTKLMFDAIYRNDPKFSDR